MAAPTRQAKVTIATTVGVMSVPSRRSSSRAVRQSGSLNLLQLLSQLGVIVVDQHRGDAPHLNHRYHTGAGREEPILRIFDIRRADLAGVIPSDEGGIICSGRNR